MVSRQAVLVKIFGDPQKRILKGLEKKVGAINALAEKYHKMSKSDLKKQTEVLKKRLEKKKNHTGRLTARCVCIGT